MPELPYEIWAYIASLLPPDVLSQVQFSLNRAFLECALAKRYRAVQFGEFANPQAFNLFRRLRHPQLAAFVRHLTVRNETFPVKLKASVPEEYRLRPARKPPLWKQLGRRRDSPTQTPEISESDVLDIVSKMTNLESFTLESFQDRNKDPRLHCSETLVYSALNTFSATLQTLRLTLSGIELPDWALPNSTLLSSLRHLTIRLDQFILAPWPDPDNAFSNSLTPFLNAHRATIETLTLGLYMCAFLNLSAIMEPLEPFPQLTTLSVTQTFPSDFTGIKDEGKVLADATHRFVRRCSPKLVRLEVDSWPAVISALANQPFSRNNRAKPQLQTLKIRLETGMPHDILSPAQLNTLIHPIAPTLVDLDISHLPLEIPQLKSLFPGATQNPPLRRLAIELTSLEPEVFNYLSVTLPKLRTLAIGYCWLNAPAPWTAVVPTALNPTGGFAAGFRLPTIEFCKCLQSSYHFDDWDLEHLRLKPLRTAPWDSCKRVITEAFPRVKTFNGASRGEYLSPTNMDNI